MQKKQTLEQWIDEAMTDEEKGPKISAISLVHLKGQQELEIHSIAFGARKWTPKELSQIFRHKAETYSEEIPGVQTFNLQAFYGGDEPRAWKPFTVNGAQDYNGGLSTEGPTPQGLVQQLMRHNEVQFQVYMRAQANLGTAQAQQVQALMDQNQSLQGTVKDFFDVLQKLLLERMTNSHDFRMKELEYQRSTAERKKWISFLPAVASNILGTDIVPQGTADTELLDLMIEQIDEAGLHRLAAANILPQETLAVLYARWQQGLKKKREEQEERDRVAKNISPEQELAGNLPG